MKKITILVGPQASGKTTRAKEMAKGKKSVIIEDSNYFFPFGRDVIPEDTELIILEAVTDVEQIIYIANRGNISVFGLKPIDLPFECPEIIIVTQKSIEHFIKPNENVEIIHCVHFDPWPVVLDEYKELSKSDVQNLKALVK